MTRGTAAALTTPFRSAGDAKMVSLVRIATGMASPAVLRYHDAPQMEALTFGGESYDPRPMDVPEQRIEAATETGAIALRIADPDAVLAGYVLAGNDFAYQRATLRVTDRAVIDAAGTAAIRADYFVESVSMEEGAVVFALKPLFGVFAMDVPHRVLTRADFPGMPPSVIGA